MSTLLAGVFGVLLAFFGATSLLIEYRTLRGSAAFKKASFFPVRYFFRIFISPASWCLLAMLAAGLYLLVKVYLTLLA